MYKTAIAPVIAVIALIIQGIFGIEIGEDVIAEVTQVVGNIVLGVVVLYGIVKTHINKITFKKKSK